jgi:hypothetical protein
VEGHRRPNADLHASEAERRRGHEVKGRRPRGGDGGGVEGGGGRSMVGHQRGGGRRQASHAALGGGTLAQVDVGTTRCSDGGG